MADRAGGALAPTTNVQYTSAVAAAEAMNSHLRDKYEEVRDKVGQISGTNLKFYHWLGRQATSIHADNATYGSGAIEKLAAALEMDRSLLYKTMTFYSLYESADAIKALTERRTANDKPITWTHMSSIVHVDRAAVPALVDLVFEKGLTVKQLRDEIRRRLFAGRAGGRPTPRTLTGGLSQFQGMSLRLAAKFDDEFDALIADPLESVGDDQVTDALLEQVRTSKATLDDLAEKARARAVELDELYGRLQEAAKTAARGDAGPAAKPAREAKPAAAPKARPAAKAKAAKPARGGKPARAGGGKGAKAAGGRPRQRRPVPA